MTVPAGAGRWWSNSRNHLSRLRWRGFRRRSRFGWVCCEVSWQESSTNKSASPTNMRLSPIGWDLRSFIGYPRLCINYFSLLMLEFYILLYRLNPKNKQLKIKLGVVCAASPSKQPQRTFPIQFSRIESGLDAFTWQEIPPRFPLRSLHRAARGSRSLRRAGLRAGR